jgi:acyl-CoA thioester hydrolase
MTRFQDYNHCIPIQVRFSDIDALRHVNNASYLNFFELGRVKYFNEVFHSEINWSRNGFIMARSEIDYLAPVFLNDDVYCYTKTMKLGTKSLTVQNVLARMNKGELQECAVGTVILVAMDYINQQSIEIPGLWRDLIKKYENK